MVRAGAAFRSETEYVETLQSPASLLIAASSPESLPMPVPDADPFQPKSRSLALFRCIPTVYPVPDR